jgi:metal-responsive CopG/Arc/MetJ family transcriptional regulator
MARIIISLPSELLEELDDYCDNHKYNRSECIRHAIRLLIQKQRYEQNDKEDE